MFAQVSRWIAAKWKMWKRGGYRGSDRIEIKRSGDDRDGASLSLIKHRRVDIYAAIFAPGSDLARDKPAIGWLIYRSKSGYRRNFSFFSRETITKVELAQKSFDFSKSIHRVENENGRDNSIEIGLERTGLDCFAGQRAVFDRTFIFPPAERERMEFFRPVGTHTLLRRRVFNNDSNERPPASNCNLAW